MECLDRYDASKGAQFETYAFIRVRGAMIDYIRSQDWVPHRARSFQKKVDEAYSMPVSYTHLDVYKRQVLEELVNLKR